MTSDPPGLAERDDVAGKSFIRERYQLLWRPADPIDVYVVRPRGIAKPPVVLYLYSYPQDTDRFKTDSWCELTTSQGYAAVGFVSAFTGHRLQYKSLKSWFVGDMQEALAQSTHDVQMVLNYLASRGDLDMDRVGMFGQGSGGSVAILASAADPRIKVVSVLTPWADWPNWLAKSRVIPDDERARYLTPEFKGSVAKLDPVDWLPKIKAKTIQIQDVRHDPNVPDDAQEKLEAAAPDTAEIAQYGDGAALYPHAAGGQVFFWMWEKLRPGAKVIDPTDTAHRVHFYPSTGKPPLPMAPLPESASPTTAPAGATAKN